MNTRDIDIVPATGLVAVIAVCSAGSAIIGLLTGFFVWAC
jgi:hypothetical protein